MNSSPDPVLVTAQTYEREAEAWHNNRARDRAAWTPSYDRFLPLVSSGGRILDLGCGSGEDEPALASAGRILYGLDISMALLRKASSRSALSGHLIRADLRLSPFADGSFDGVWADGTLHHVAKADLASVLAGVSRVLKHGGVFSASVERGER